MFPATFLPSGHHRSPAILAAAGLLAIPAVAPACAAGPEASADWAFSADGTLVLDLRAQLAWPRCVEGMRWNAQAQTCTGQPRQLDRAEAAALAAERCKADNVPWRLPRAAELQRLVDRQASPVGLNAARFPAAPTQWHWCATANVAAQRGNPYNYNTVLQGATGPSSASQMAAINGWAVNLSTGEARGDVARTSKLPVRLVRPLTAADTAR